MGTLFQPVVDMGSCRFGRFGRVNNGFMNGKDGGFVKKPGSRKERKKKKKEKKRKKKGGMLNGLVGGGGVGKRVFKTSGLEFN